MASLLKYKPTAMRSTTTAAPMRVILLFLLACLLQPTGALAQGSGLPLGSEDYRIAQRLEIKYAALPPYHPSLKTWDRGNLVRYALQLDSLATLSEADRQDLLRIFTDNNEWLGQGAGQQTLGGRKNGRFVPVKGDSLYRFVPDASMRDAALHPYYFRNKKPVWGFFYPTPANWVEINEPFFYLRLNPLLEFKAGAPDSGAAVFINRRGVELRGGFDNRIFFYSQITDTQLRWPEYLRTYVEKNKAVPGNGFYKNYESTLFNSQGAYDILNGQAFIGMRITRHVGLQFGHGKNFIGNGYRSLLLSDFSHNYLYLKFNWEFGKLVYQNLFAELQSTSAQANPGAVVIPRKYLAAHYLSYRPVPAFSIGLYEAVVFSRDGQFELGYLNPVILYRTVEHLLDSKDNVLLGLDAKLDIWKQLRLYGQFVLDEFKSTEVFSGKGWWANKWGWQLGGHWVDAFGLDHLDVQAEYNKVRPFTYTHDGELGASYTHYNQALAHPLGANFKEWLLRMSYQPRPRLRLQARFIHYLQGQDPPGENWGSNLLLPNETHTSEYGNEIGKPLKTNANIVGLDASWEIYHNLWLDLHYFYRNTQSDNDVSKTSAFFAAGLRLNLAVQRFDF